METLKGWLWVLSVPLAIFIVYSVFWQLDRTLHDKDHRYTTIYSISDEIYYVNTNDKTIGSESGLDTFFIDWKSQDEWIQAQLVKERNIWKIIPEGSFIIAPWQDNALGIMDVVTEDSLGQTYKIGWVALGPGYMDYRYIPEAAIEISNK